MYYDQFPRWSSTIFYFTKHQHSFSFGVQFLCPLYLLSWQCIDHVRRNILLTTVVRIAGHLKHDSEQELCNEYSWLWHPRLLVPNTAHASIRWVVYSTLYPLHPRVPRPSLSSCLSNILAILTLKTSIMLLVSDFKVKLHDLWNILSSLYCSRELIWSSSLKERICSYSFCDIWKTQSPVQ